MKTEIVHINTNAVNEIRDCKKAHTDVDRKDEQKKSELQNALGELERKIEARTDDMIEKQRRIERKHDEKCEK